MKKGSLLYPILLVLLVVELTSQAFAQQVVFHKLNPSSGTSSQQFLGIDQDVNGTMWFATTNGVYSYDGIQINTFSSNVLDPNSLANNFAHSVCADKDGMIWIATLGSGLDMLNPKTGDFTHFAHDPKDPASLVNDTVIVVFIDSQGIYWIGTHSGLDKFEPETNTFIHYKHDANDTTSISSDQVRVIYEDRKGTLWIGTGSPYTDRGNPEIGGLNKLNRETDTFTRYKHDSNDIHSLSNNKVSAIFEDDKGVFWIGTSDKGIQKMDREKGTFELAFTETELPELYRDYEVSNRGLNSDYISFITQDVAGKIWFATTTSGIFKYDPVTKETLFIYGPEDSSSGFSEIGARTAFSSRDGVFWVGTDDWSENVFYLDPAIRQIRYTSTGASVGSFYEEPNGDFWIGTMNEMVRSIGKNGEIRQYVTTDYDRNAFFNNGYLINGDREGNIWIATTESLNRFDKKTEKFIAYNHDPQDTSSVSHSHINTTYEDSKSNFWIGTPNGLNLMNRKTGVFSRFYAHPEHKDKLGKNVVLCIAEDKSGDLWIGHWGRVGVSRFDPETKDFKDYLKGVSVDELFLDSDGLLWAGTPQALFRYEPGIDEFVPFTGTGSLFSILKVSSIVEDKQKNLWLNASDKIVRINPERNEISFFGENYGVGHSDLNWRSGYIKRNGEIYFGDETGYFSFFPDEIIKNMQIPELVFTGLSLASKRLVPGDGGPLKESLNEQKEIRLAYDQNVFSIDLAIIDYVNPKENKLICFLENYDINWREANLGRAYYFNVPPGEYIFRVKGVNSYGAWNEKSINVFIDPPWWRTWLAYTIYSLLFVILVFGIDRIMRRRILLAERQKNQERELAQAREIEKAYTELKSTQFQLIQSEKMASLGELTAGIAHEIQNPLNFVNNFSEVSKELIGEMREELNRGDIEEAKIIAGDIDSNLDKVNHHGQRASTIVRSMLDHSRSGDGKLEPADVNVLADEYLRLAYHGLRAKDKSFQADFKTEFAENMPKIDVVTQDFGRVLLNLINNAFYAVNKKSKEGIDGYNPLVVVGSRVLKGSIEIFVKDNGLGIPGEIRDKIFQPFFTTKPTGEGTGLGLSLSYDIITKGHGGELRVETLEGEGTTFTIELDQKGNIQ